MIWVEKTRLSHINPSRFFVLIELKQRRKKKRLIERERREKPREKRDGEGSNNNKLRIQLGMNFYNLDLCSDFLFVYNLKFFVMKLKKKTMRIKKYMHV